MKQKAIWVIFWRYEAKGLNPGQTHIVALPTRREALKRVASLRTTCRYDSFWANVADPVRFTAK